MKRLLYLLILLLAISCSKEPKINQGTYSCSVAGETLYIELLSGEDCVLYFKGQKESTGYYHINGEEITIIGHAWLEKRYSIDIYSFGPDNRGTIYSSDKFGITADVNYGEDSKYCSFVRRN